MSARKVVHLQCLKDTWQKPIEEASILRNGGLAPEELTVAPMFSDPTDPSILDGATHLTIGGSGWSVFETVPLYAEFALLVRTARERGLPILGMCFGGQALAQIFGGMVIRSEANAEYGTVNIRVSTEAEGDMLFGSRARTTFAAQVSHQDRIVGLPAGAVKLAWSHVGEPPVQIIQAFSFPGERVWGLQFHPERDDGTVRTLMTDPSCSYSQMKRGTIERTLAPSPDACALLAEFLRL